MVSAEKKIRCKSCKAQQTMSSTLRKYIFDKDKDTWFRVYSCYYCSAEMWTAEVGA